MCGRYTNELEFSQLKLAFDAADETFRPWTSTYNISPSAGPGHEQLFVCQNQSGARALRLGRFWLIPSWWHEPLSRLPTLFNARSENLTEKRIWRTAFESSRCLIPATGWREFVARAGKKQPYHFDMMGEPFAFAGLSSSWRSPDGEDVRSFAIITTTPSEQAARYHDRMPLIMPRKLYDSWLDPRQMAAEALTEATQASLSRPLRIYATNPIGNNTRFEGPEVIAPLSDDAAVPEPPSPAKGNPDQLSLPLGGPEATKRS